MADEQQPAQTCPTCGAEGPFTRAAVKGLIDKVTAQQPAQTECPARKALAIQRKAWDGVKRIEADSPAVDFAEAQIIRIDAALSLPCPTPAGECPKCAKNERLAQKYRDALECATGTAKRRGSECDQLRVELAAARHAFDSMEGLAIVAEKLWNFLEKCGVQSVYLGDGTQINPASESLRGVVCRLYEAEEKHGEVKG